MSEMPTNPASGPVAGNLSPMEAVRMGWRLLRSDFWPLALAGLVVAGILLALRFVPCVSYCEPIIVPFLWPPLMAGLFLVIHRRIDGYPVDVGAVFDGFRQRYWQSVVAALPITLVFLVMGALLIVVMMGAGMGVGMLMPQRSQDMELAQVAVMYGAIFVAILIEYVIVGVISLFLMFAMLIVWERPDSG
ncbi:MAG: hypothetical protein IMZ65_03875, partial [Planctomycetes bacterium]|nr:hypothetical protein [Planctomycetota bacterium]